MKRHLPFSFALAIGIALGSTSSVYAAGSDPAAAQALFNDAKTLMAQNRWGDACPKLEESQKLDPGIGTQFNLANCYQHIGRTASAWAMFLEAAQGAKAAGQPAREKVARDRASALESKLSRLTITLKGADPTNLKVMRDGVEVGRGQWSTPVPIDPGEHRITASAPGKKTWEKSFHVAPDAKVVNVDIPVLADDATPLPMVASAPAPAPQQPMQQPAPQQQTEVTTTAAPQRVVTAPPRDDDGRGNGQRAVGWVASGLGLAGLGVGTGFGIASKQRRDDSNKGHCDAQNHCDATGVQLRHEAVQYGTISTAGFIAGGALFVGGVVLLLTAPKSERTTAPATARWEAAPMFGAGTTGMSVSGRW